MQTLLQPRFLSSSSRINATSTWIRVLPLLLEKVMPMPNAASWISVLRTIAYLFWDQLFHPEKDVLICFCCHLADTLHHSSITFQQSDPFTSRRVCLLHWLVATKDQISVSANPSQSSWCTLSSSPWTSLTTALICLELPAVSGFLVSYALVSSPSTRFKSRHPPCCQRCPSRFRYQSRQLQNPHFVL